MPTAASFGAAPPVGGRAAARLRDAGPYVVLLGAASWWVFGHMVGRLGRGVASYDIYNAFYPNAVYALRSLRTGHGLEWIAEQNCGQPFLPSTLLAPFYPLNLVVLVAGADQGVLVAAAIHLALAGVGMYLLCREIGLGRVAALCGALSFQLGNHLIHLAAWLPVAILGSFVWLPFALLCCERVLRAPSLRGGVWLGIFLTLSVLGGYPQMTLFLYQMIVLRTAWEVVTRGVRPTLRAAGALSLGCLLPLALGAAQLVPAMEFAAHSYRARLLRLDEMAPGQTFVDWQRFREALATREWHIGRSYPVLFAALAPVALLCRATRRQAGFYACVAALFTVLAIDGPLQRAYLTLPLGSLFRLPMRLLFLASFAAHMLIALGADALLRPSAGWVGRDVQRPPPRWLPALALAGAAALWLLQATPPPGSELLAMAALLLVATAAAWPDPSATRWRPALGLTLALLVGASALFVSRLVLLGYADGAALLGADAPVFDVLRERMSAQDRLYIVASDRRYGLLDKTPTLFGLPSIADYEPQTSQRLTDLDVMMRFDRPMASVNDALFKFTRMPRNRRILDLLAARYLVHDPAAEPLPPALAASLRRIARVGDVDIYENPQSLPRAFFVPTATVEPDPVRRVQALSSGDVDPRRSVVLDAAPPAGAGGPPGGRGDADIEEDRSEMVRVRVHAGTPGFLVLTDQLYPGWSAVVNGVATPVLRANHAFRAVPVPAGVSTVVFTYRPWSVRVGLGVSLVALVGVLVLLGRNRRARRRNPVARGAAAG